MFPRIIQLNRCINPRELIIFRLNSKKITPCNPCSPAAVPITKVCIQHKIRVCPSPPCPPPKGMGPFQMLWWVLWRSILLYMAIKYTKNLGIWGQHKETMKLYDHLFRIWVPIFNKKAKMRHEQIRPPRLDYLYFTTGEKWNRGVNAVFARATAYGVALDQAIAEMMSTEYRDRQRKKRACPPPPCDIELPEEPSELQAWTEEDLIRIEEEVKENKREMRRAGFYECP